MTLAEGLALEAQAGPEVFADGAARRRALCGAARAAAGAGAGARLERTPPLCSL